MRIPHFRVRTMMIAVAIVGGLLAAGVEVKRLSRIAAAHRDRARLHAVEESRLLADVERMEALVDAVEAQYQAAGPHDPARELMGKTARQLRREADEFRPKLREVTALKLKYERAASRPWETVPLDPR